MPEHQNIEYKESWRDEYLKWICGFANANGGKIFIGIDERKCDWLTRDKDSEIDRKFSVKNLEKAILHQTI